MKAFERAKNYFIGNRFNHLVVISFDCIRNGARHWLCRCDCGNIKSINGSYLKNDYTISCGCKQKTSKQLPKGEAARNRLYDQYRNNAKSRKIEFKLSKEDFLKICVEPCCYCGAVQSSSMKKRISNLNGDFLYTGIDRIDSTKGYELNNCVPCCSICNKMKLDLSIATFLEHVRKIVQFTNEA